MNNDAIGVFDSGIGGLTAVKELIKLMPNENIVYFGDTARVPYGTRSKEIIIRYAKQDVEFLTNLRTKVKMVIAACGTISSVIGSQPLTLDIPFTGVILPAAQAACGATRIGKVGVIGTTATIKSGSYGKAIRSIRPEIIVIGNSCPLLVPLVENGFVGKENKVTRLVLEQYLAPIIAEKVDTLILGCTHYPMLRDAIAEIVGEDVILISPGEEAANHTLKVLSHTEMLTERKSIGTCEFYVSDSVDLFAESAKIFLGHSIDSDITKVTID